ncbi:Uncharacterized protein GBIM_00328, partial [Gryllus bimaculatus]
MDSSLAMPLPYTTIIRIPTRESVNKRWILRATQCRGEARCHWQARAGAVVACAGNALHEALLARGALRHVNMTVPEAIAAAGARAKFVCEWRSLVYLMDLGASLFEQLAETLADWERNPPPRRHGHDLYVVLIADNRSVLLVFQKDQDRVSLIDSHQHQAHGAVVVQVQTAYLQQLCAWYNSLLQSCYGARPECYEL